MQQQQAAMRPEGLARLTARGAWFFLAAALTAAQLPGGSAPFALGCVAAAGAGGEGMAALLGAALGSLVFQSFAAGVQQLAAVVLILTASFALRDLRLFRLPAVPAVCAGGLTLTVGMVYVLQALEPMRQLPDCLTAAAFTGLAAWMYAPLLGEEGARRRDLSLRFLAVTLLAAFVPVRLGEFSLGRIMLTALTVVTGWQGGLSAGMSAGLWTGFLMDVQLDFGTLFFTAAYGLVGLASGLCGGRGRLRAAAASLAVTVALTLRLADAQAAVLLGETVLSLPLLLAIPGRMFGGKRLQREGAAPTAVQDAVRTRLDRAAAAFRDLYDSLGRSTAAVTDENPAVIFDRAAERTCRDCALCSLCWKKEYVSTFNALNDATPFLLERGRPLAKDFPSYFTARCIHLQDFLTAVGTELTAFLLRRQYHRQLEESRRSQRSQYARMGELLSAAAAGLGESAPAMAKPRPYRIGAVLRPREGETVCGDSVTSFEGGDGQLHLLLSDGSGSGEGARRESALTSRLLRQFLEAGIAPEAALKTLNAALALRSETTGAFATIDLLTVTPGSGEAALYKYGAAPTYIKRGGSVRRITGTALPAGLREFSSEPDVTRLTLRGGSFVVMISDGVADVLSDDWLQNVIAGWEGEDPQTLAAVILQESGVRGGGSDDRCVQVLHLPEEEVRGV